MYKADTQRGKYRFIYEWGKINPPLGEKPPFGKLFNYAVRITEVRDKNENKIIDAVICAKEHWGADEKEALDKAIKSFFKDNPKLKENING